MSTTNQTEMLSTEQIIAQFKAKFNSPLTQEELTKATFMLQQLQLPAENVQSLQRNQFNILQSAFNQLTDCAKCNGNRITTCRKYFVEFDGEKLNFLIKPCDVQAKFKINQTANAIIRSSQLPPIFRKKRAIDFVNFYKGNSTVLDAAEAAITEDIGLFLYGDSGAGKTFLSCVIAIERAHKLKYSLFVNVPDLLEDLREFNNNKPTEYTDSINRQDKLQKMYNTPCLIIDDLGAEKPSDWTCEILFKIINYRYNHNTQTVISSNFDLNGLNERFSKFTGTRIIRRISDICQIVKM